MAGCHYWLDGHEFGWTLGVGDGQGGLACCNSWGRKESDTTEQLNWTELGYCETQMNVWKCLKWRSEVAWSCPTLCNPLDCSLPGFSVHGILQARILEWVTISFSRGFSQPRDEPSSPALEADTLTSEQPGKPKKMLRNHKYMCKDSLLPVLSMQSYLSLSSRAKTLSKPLKTELAYR